MVSELKKEPRLLALTRDGNTPHVELAESKRTSEGYCVDGQNTKHQTGYFLFPQRKNVFSYTTMLPLKHLRHKLSNNIVTRTVV